MTQPNLPFDIPWLTDPERDDAAQRYTGLIALCQDRGHTPDALTVERIRLIMITDATANRLEARLAAQLEQPSQRVPGVQANATTIARHRHARALDDFDAAYPRPAAEPAPPVNSAPSIPGPDPSRPYSHVFIDSDQYRKRVIEVMERMAPELDPFEDPVVTAYFMEKDWGRKFHYELPKEAYTDIIRKPPIGGPIDPITREPLISTRYQARQAKWDEIRRQKAEAKAKEEAEAQDKEDGMAKEEARPQSESDPQPQQDPSTTPNPKTPPHTTAQDPSDPPAPSESVHPVHPVHPSAPPDPPAPSHSSHSSHHSHSPLLQSPPPIRVHPRSPVAPTCPAEALRRGKPREGGSVANNPPPPTPNPRPQPIPSRTRKPPWETKDPK